MLMNTLVGFTGKQLNAIGEVVLEHGSGIVSRKDMELKCRARVNGQMCQYPPATIFKNDAMKLTIVLSDVAHHIPGMFRIPWQELGLFQGKDQKDLRATLKASDAERLKAITATLKGKIAGATKTTPATPAVTATVPVAPTKAKRKNAAPAGTATGATASTKVKSKKGTKPATVADQPAAPETAIDAGATL